MEVMIIKLTLLRHLRLGTHFERYSFLFRASWKLPKNVGWNLESSTPWSPDGVLYGGDRSERLAKHMLGVILHRPLLSTPLLWHLEGLLGGGFSRKVFSMYSQITVESQMIFPSWSRVDDGLGVEFMQDQTDLLLGYRCSGHSNRALSLRGISGLWRIRTTRDDRVQAWFSSLKTESGLIVE